MDEKLNFVEVCSSDEGKALPSKVDLLPDKTSSAVHTLCLKSGRIGHRARFDIFRPTKVLVRSSSFFSDKFPYGLLVLAMGFCMAQREHH